MSRVTYPQVALKNAHAKPDQLNFLLHENTDIVLTKIFGEDVDGGYTVAKRVVYVQMCRFVLDYLIRNQASLGGERAIGMALSGESPYHASALPLLFGLVNGIDFYEEDTITACTALSHIPEARKRIVERWPKLFGRRFDDFLFFEKDVTRLSLQRMKELSYSYFDFDFCHNPFRVESERKGMLRFIRNTADRQGHVLISVTSHRGYWNSPSWLLREQAKKFESNLRRSGFDVEAKTQYPYSEGFSNPMTLFVWILK